MRCRHYLTTIGISLPAIAAAAFIFSPQSTTPSRGSWGFTDTQADEPGLTSFSTRLHFAPKDGVNDMTTHPNSLMTVFSQAESATSTATLPSSTTTVPEQISPPPEKMEEGIYNFNKLLIDTVYNIICFLYPIKGNSRDFARFYVLETVARVPYFAYLSVLHFRETIGLDRDLDIPSLMRTHYAEADNELHHLLIMESLGGNSSAVDRAVAQTAAFAYYWYVVVIYGLVSPKAAYHLSELIEDHAYDTYNGFLTQWESRLKTLPVPAIAQKYYVEDPPFMFDLFCTVVENGVTGPQRRELNRPKKLESLYDVFVNVRDDEKEHWKTLCTLVQYGDKEGNDAGSVVGTLPMPKEQGA